MTRQEFEQHITPWLALQNCPGIGPLRASTLLAQFGSPSAIFAQPIEALAKLLGNARYALAVQPFKDVLD